MHFGRPLIDAFVRINATVHFVFIVVSAVLSQVKRLRSFTLSPISCYPLHLLRAALGRSSRQCSSDEESQPPLYDGLTRYPSFISILLVVLKMAAGHSYTIVPRGDSRTFKKVMSRVEGLAPLQDKCEGPYIAKNSWKYDQHEKPVG